MIVKDNRWDKQTIQIIIRKMIDHHDNFSNNKI